MGTASALLAATLSNDHCPVPSVERESLSLLLVSFLPEVILGPPSPARLNALRKGGDGIPASVPKRPLWEWGGSKCREQGERLRWGTASTETIGVTLCW